MSKRQRVKDLAEERIRILVAHAVSDPAEEHASRLARTAKKISMHYRVRMPYEFRQLYCKKCKQMIIPGRSSRVRIGRSNTRAVRITCLKCGHVYRKVFPSNKDL